MTQPPQWISVESWQAFHESRKKLKAPLTAYAEKLIIMELVRLKTAGHDPQACLDQTILNGWRDVFPLRDKQIRQNGNATAETQQYLAELASIPRDSERARAAIATARAGIRVVQ